MTDEASISSNWRSEEHYTYIKRRLGQYWDDLDDDESREFMAFLIRSLLIDGFEHPYDDREGEIARTLSIANSISDPKVDRKDVDAQFRDQVLQGIARSVQHKRAVHDETEKRTASLGSSVDELASRLGQLEVVLARFTYPFRATREGWRLVVLPLVRRCRAALSAVWVFANTPVGLVVLAALLSGVGALLARLAGAY